MILKNYLKKIKVWDVSRHLTTQPQIPDFLFSISNFINKYFYKSKLKKKARMFMNEKTIELVDVAGSLSVMSASTCWIPSSILNGSTF